MQEVLFYREGLRFECQRCSRCCRHEPGYVFLSEDDLQAMCAGTGYRREDFIKTYCKTVRIGGTVRLSLRERDNYDCIFWENGSCSVYSTRPLQCRSYPFWAPFLYSRKTWDDLAEDCPGVNRGKLHTRKEIDTWLQLRWKEPFLDETNLS